jgi:SprT protein
MKNGLEQTTRNELKELARALTSDLIQRAARHFRATMPRTMIRFDLRGKSAGQFRSLNGRDFEIRYNSVLLARHGQDFLDRTVPHEAAHLVALRIYGPGIPPHGAEWQAIMRLFGAEPERCHNYDTDGLQARHLRRYHYRCGCRSHQLTSIRHNRILRGQTYLCRRCGEALQWSRAETGHCGDDT